MTLVHEMERIGRITAADQNLEVRVRGVQAYATPGRVTIPNLETFGWLGDNAYRMLHGLLDHECGHAADTDFEATKQWRLNDRPPQALDFLINMIEDGYVERLRGLRYKGCGQNITLMNEWFYAHKSDDGEDVISRIANSSNKWLSFISAIGMVLTPYGHRDIEFFKPINSDIYHMLCECRADIEELQSIIESKATARNIEIGKRIYDRFNQNSEQNQEKEKDPSGDEDDKEQEGESEDQESQDGNEDQDTEDKEGDDQEKDNGGERQPPEDDEADDGPGDDDDLGSNDDGGEDSEDGEDEGESGEGSGDDNESEDTESEDGKPEEHLDEGTFIMDLDRWSDYEDTPLNPSAQINMILGEVFEQNDDTQPYTIFSREFDAYRDFAAEDQADVSDLYEREMSHVYDAADSLVHAFEAALRASQMARPIGGNDEGEVDGDALVEYAVGSLPADQLYIQMAETDSDNVAVSILCDCSGSMHGNKYVLCRRAAMAISNALQQVHIAHEVSGFTTFRSGAIRHHPWAKGKEAEYMDNFDRLRRALMEAAAQGTNVALFARETQGASIGQNTTLKIPFHVQFKSFDSDDARSLARIGAIDENLDGEAVLWIAERLAKRSEKRKVLFVLSDGLPAGSKDNLQGRRYLQETIARVIESGIEVYGIGIQSDHVKAYYPEWWVCDKIEDLISIAMEGLAEVLTQNRTERDHVDL